MQKSIFLFALVFSSCIGVRETIINVETKEKMIGFSSDCKYQIGKTKKSEFTEEFLAQLENDSLYLVFNDAAFDKESQILLGGGGGGKYAPSRGLKHGDPLEKALKLYGKPVATDLEYWWDKQHRVKWSFEGLFYKNMTILIDTSQGNTVRGGVLVGRSFAVDKKYRRKSSWFKE